MRRSSGRSPAGRSATIRLVGAGRAGVVGEALPAVGLEERRVRHRDQRHATRARVAARQSRHAFVRIPAASARSAARRITGPSASGSEKGKPISTRSAPPCLGGGGQLGRLHARPSGRSRAPAHAAMPAASWSAPRGRRGQPPDSQRQRLGPLRITLPRCVSLTRACRMCACSRGSLRQVAERLVEVLVAAAGEADDDHVAVQLGGAGERMRWLERRDDPLRLGQPPEGGERLLVGARPGTRRGRCRGDTRARARRRGSRARRRSSARR